MKTSTSATAKLRLIPIVLTLCLAALAGMLSALCSWPVVLVCLAPSPVALILIWLTREVDAPVDRIAAADAERAKRPVSHPAPALARAA